MWSSLPNRWHTKVAAAAGRLEDLELAGQTEPVLWTWACGLQRVEDLSKSLCPPAILDAAQMAEPKARVRP